MKEYTFTEPIRGTQTWHIRELTGDGQQLEFGADTPSLCGQRMHRDLNVDLTERHLAHGCVRCVAMYREVGE